MNNYIQLTIGICVFFNIAIFHQFISYKVKRANLLNDFPIIQYDPLGLP